MNSTNHKIGIIAIVGVTIYDGYDGVLYSGVGVKKYRHYRHYRHNRHG